MSALTTVDTSIYIPGKMSAPQCTHLLKEIGDGDMCSGIACLVKHSYLVGNEAGYIEGYRQGHSDGYGFGLLDCLNTNSIDWKTVGIAAAIAGGVLLMGAGINITAKMIKRAKSEKTESIDSDNEGVSESGTEQSSG